MHVHVCVWGKKLIKILKTTFIFYLIISLFSFLFNTVIDGLLMAVRAADQKYLIRTYES